MRTEEEIRSRISYLSGIVKGLEMSIAENDIEIDDYISDYKQQLLGLYWVLNINEKERFKK